MALRVLLADNSESIKKVILISLQEHGVDLKVVSSGLDVIDVALKFNPEIIFVDILLQKQSGYDVSRLLKTHPVLKTIPVILMWSGFMDLDEDKARQALADARLEKPFEAETLRALVRKLVVPKAAPVIPKSAPSMQKTAVAPSALSAHLEMPDEPGAGPINIRDHLDSPDEPMRANALPEVDLSGNVDEFEEVGINDLNGLTNEPAETQAASTKNNPFELGLPEDSDGDEIQVEYKEPEAVKNMDFLLNREEDSKFEITVAKPAPGVNVSHAQLEEIVKQQCQEIIEKMAWKLVPELASKIVKEELNRLIRDLEK